MNYKVLYRKYRPDNFDNLVGQEFIVKILKNSIINNKVAHAYIFSGPRGTGKTSTAKIFAKNINCLNPIEGNACGECENCLSFEGSPDVIEIDAASNNGVDNIREIINNIKLAPNKYKYKVYIIDEVHMLSTSAFNALLLTLEEPPKHAIFILATTNIESVPITILSRCQRFDFKKITKENIVNRLSFICKNENIQITDDALEEISYLSDGGLRDALSILDQISKENSKIDIDIVNKEIGSVSLLQIKKLIENLDKNDYESIQKIIQDFKDKGYDYKIIIKKTIDVCTKNAKNILKGQKFRLSFEEYKKLIIELSDLINKVNVNIEALDLYEITLLSFIKIKDDSNIQVLKTNNDLNNKALEDNCYKINDDINKIKINNCFVKATKSKKIEMLSNWSDFIEDCQDKKISKLIKNTKLVLASDDIIVVTSEFDSITSELNLLQNNIIESFNLKFNINCDIVFVSSNVWLEETKKYMENVKNGVKYSIKDLPSTDSIDNSLNDIFTNVVIEEE